MFKVGISGHSKVLVIMLEE